MDKMQAEIIKETHQSLRKKLASGKTFKEVWKLHCSEHGLLEQYSIAMKDLATTVWDVDCDGTDRTKWCKDICIEYFFSYGSQKFLEKDERRKLFFINNPDNFVFHNESVRIDNYIAKEKIPLSFPKVGEDKIRLLDVGSCYNPFAAYSEFNTIAIDLFPARETVLKCDFLSVEINKLDTYKEYDQILKSSGLPSLSTLPQDYFHVVVFSLLLSYIPCPHSRWLMCEKAHKVLCRYGLLLIITPDSSHQNRHAHLMKKWKVAIENIGFHRIKYVKDKHMHFIAFRKVPTDYIWDKRKCVPQEDPKNLKYLNIPQDFN